jgi:hypothetical protein
MKAAEYFQRDEWSDDAQELIHLNLDTSNVHVTNSISTANITVSSNALIRSVECLTADVETTLSASNVVSGNVSACNVVAGTLDATAAQAHVFNARSNLMWGGHSLYDQYPGDSTDWDELIPFNEDMEGMIDVSWLKKPLSAKDVLTELWDLAEGGIQVLETLSNLAGWFFPEDEGVLPQAVLDALQSALDGGTEDPQSNDNTSVYPSWSNLKSKPIAVTSNLSIGMKDLYISDAGVIKSLPASFLTKSGRDNLAITATTGAVDVIRMGTREMFPNTLCIGADSNAWLDSSTLRIGGTSMSDPHAFIVTQDSFRFGSNGAFAFNASNDVFKLRDWILSSNSITCPGSADVYLNNRLKCTGNISCPLLNTEQIVSTSNGYIWFTANNLTTSYKQAFTENLDDTTSSYVVQDAHSWKWQSKMSTTSNGGVIAPKVTRFSVDDSGSVFAGSNIFQQSPALIRAVKSATLDELPAEGHLMLEPTSLRFIQRQYTDSVSYTDTINSSLNSNGLFLLQRPAVFGKNESFEELDPNTMQTFTRTNFPRLDITLNNGLVFGEGINSFPNVSNRNFFRVQRDGSVSTWASDTSQLVRIVNSNAEIGQGDLRLTKEGALKNGSSTIIQPGGTIQRRANPEQLDGWQVSPTGFVTQGSMNWYPNGDLYHGSRLIYSTATGTFACSNVSITSNLSVGHRVTASNITVSNLQASNATFAESITVPTLNCTNANVSSTLNAGIVKANTVDLSASPGGNFIPLVVNNSNINFGSGAGVLLQTGGNWAARVVQSTQGDGNQFRVDLTHGSSTFSNAFELRNNQGNITGRIGAMLFSDWGYGAGWYGISHSNHRNDPEAYGFLQNQNGNTIVNCKSSNQTIELRTRGMETIARFSDTTWSIGLSADGTFSRGGQGNGPFVKTSKWKLTQLINGTQTVVISINNDLWGGWANYEDVSWTGELTVYMAQGTNGAATALVKLYLTNIWGDQTRIYSKSIDSRTCTVTFPGIYQEDPNIVLNVSTQMAYCFKFEGAV